jgi:restriction endonuclease S subunit
VFDNQKKIANFLPGIDKKIELVEQETRQVKEFKRGLPLNTFVKNRRYREWP